MLTRVFIWKKAPFIRFLLPLIAGIILQWYLQLPVQILWFASGASVLLLLLLFLLPGFSRYKLSIINGIAVTVVFLALGGLLVWYKDIRHDPRWYGNSYKPGDLVMVTIQAPLVEKTNSYKTTGTVRALKNSGRFISANGDVILYFKKNL